MKNKLKKRFVIITTLISFIVISIIIFFINMYNYKFFIQTGKDYLKDFLENKEQLEIEEINPYFSRHEDIYILSYGEHSDVELRRERQEMHRRMYILLTRLLKDKRGEGIYKNYRFYNDRQAKVLYLFNVGRTYKYYYKTLRSSLLILLLSTLIVFLLSYVLSGYAIKPILKNQNKQKKFITDASHELKTPLSIIKANIELLECNNKDNKYVNNIRTATERLNYLADDLLSLAKLDESKREDYDDFDFSVIAKEILEYYEDVLLSEKNCALISEVDNVLDCYASEKDYIKIINILLDNAYKYANNGTEVSFKIYKRAKRIFIESVNYASNLKKREYNEIFDRFTRLEFAKSESKKGSGIGLSIVKSIVESYNGNVNASSDGERLKIAIDMKCTK